VIRRLRLLERAGRAFGFSPEGKGVRVWVLGAPGADETEVVTGTVRAVADGRARVVLDEPHGELREFDAAPRERGFGLDALWFSFIAVDAFEPGATEPFAHWFVRLGKR
jgi:hypothetical protein